MPEGTDKSPSSRAIASRGLSNYNIIIDPQDFMEVSLKKHLWDAEDRLRAADLNPENDADKPLIAVYTYDASGERSIKYVPGRLDARYSAKEAGKADRLEPMLYPNPLLSAKTLPIPEMRNVKDPKLISYTKHYFIGSERIASVIGSKRGLGAYYGPDEPTISLLPVEELVDAAGTAVQDAFVHFGKTIILPQPYSYMEGYNGSSLQDPENYAAYCIRRGKNDREECKTTRTILRQAQHRLGIFQLYH